MSQWEIGSLAHEETDLTAPCRVVVVAVFFNNWELYLRSLYRTGVLNYCHPHEMVLEGKEMQMKRFAASAVLLLTGALASAADVAAPKSAEDSGQWVKVNEGKTGERRGSTVVYVPELKQMLLVGAAKGAPFVQAFDPETKSWGTFSEAEPFKSDLNNPSKQPAFTYQTAYDPGTKTIYCLSCGNVLYAFHTVDKTWKTFPAAPELEDLAWQTLACDPVGKQLVVVGAEKKGDRLGWSRTVVYDIAAGKWQRLEVADAAVVKEHKELVAATESLIDLIGRIRLAWFRDPKGVGSDAERAALLERCAALKNVPQMGRFAAEIDQIIELVDAKKTLDALKAARACQRKVEEVAEGQYPVPCSRRNSPLVYDQKNRAFVLFGGDHQDYLMNDTWVLDLEKKGWRRARPDLAPSPRAGHALVVLPGCGKLALYEGYLQSNNTDYAAGPYSLITPVQLWLYDLKTDHWDLAGSWAAPDKGDKGDPSGIAPVGYFYGGEGNNLFSAPALAADAADRLVLAGTDTKEVGWCRWKRAATTWMLQLGPTRMDAAARAKLGTEANQRLYRVSPFRAEFCEVAEVPKDTGLENLPPNQWVKLPAPPRNPCQGCRGRDWSTSIWDPDRDEILLWGGGHCVRSASTVAHYSPVSGRIVEGFDADESYGSNTPADGTLALDSSVLGRPWISIHNYKHYAYDPKSKLMVAGRNNVSVAKLKTILEALGTTLGEFFHSGAPAPVKVVYRKDELTEIAGPTRGVSFKEVAGGRPGRALQLLVERYEPGCDTGPEGYRYGGPHCLDQKNAFLSYTLDPSFGLFLRHSVSPR
jgi:hypothetical protein